MADESRKTVWRSFRGNSRVRLLLVCLLLLSAGGLAVYGVRLWRANQRAAAEDDEQDADEKPEKPKKPRKKPDFAGGTLRMQPRDERPRQWMKPGHWSAFSQRLVANNYDFTGHFSVAAVDQYGRPIQLEHSPYAITTSRPASLPKGQWKTFDQVFRVPLDTGEEDGSVTLQSQLVSARSGNVVHERRQRARRLRPHQFLMVVLAAEDAAYTFIENLDSVRAPWDDFNRPESKVHYFVLRPELSRGIPLPESSLLWTSTAYILWDDVAPGRLSAAQQQALLDWLHWGGQLVISGPKSLVQLRSSFLKPYLPAEGESTTTAKGAQIAALNRTWVLPVSKTEDSPARLVVPPDRPLSILDMQLTDGSQWIPATGKLVAERRVGRGRIAVTAFGLTDSILTTWPAFDHFFNGALLRRPGRNFTRGENSLTPQVTWRDELAGHRLDPRLLSGLRYFSRDAGDVEAVTLGRRRATSAEPEPSPYGAASGSPSPRAAASFKPASSPKLPERGFSADPQSGVAGWTDFSAAAIRARDALKQAAGIEIPSRAFVLQTLAAYIVVLVPLNWLVFRLMGRVEWAWIAAPLIAIGCGVVVIRAAQLNIGFSRAQTEVAILELQGDYDRGHLTRYQALYTSLSTGYELRYDGAHVFAQPFSADPSDDELKLQGRYTTQLHRGEGVTLSGLQVMSNTTGMVHSEQMVDAGDGLKLTGRGRYDLKVTSGIRFTLKHVALIRRTTDISGKSRIETAWIGRLAEGQTIRVQFERGRGGNSLATRWQDSPAGEKEQGDLTPLLRLAAEPERLQDGDVRLVGVIDEAVAPVEIRPVASQVSSRTVVVANLRYGRLPQPDTDVSDRLAIERQSPMTDSN